MAAGRKPGCGSPRRRVMRSASPRRDRRRSGRASSRRGSISRRPSTPRSPTLQSHRRRASNARWASGSPARTCGGGATTSSPRRHCSRISPSTPTPIRPCSARMKDVPAQSSPPVRAASAKPCTATACALPPAAGDFRSATKAAARGWDCTRCARRIVPSTDAVPSDRWSVQSLPSPGPRGRHCWRGAIDPGRMPMPTWRPWFSTPLPPDPFAAHLLDRAARALEEIAAALDPQATLPLAICGSVGQKLLPRFDAAIRARHVEPAGDAVDGAFRLLRQALSGSAG